MFTNYFQIVQILLKYCLLYRLELTSVAKLSQTHSIRVEVRLIKYMAGDSTKTQYSSLSMLGAGLYKNIGPFSSSAYYVQFKSNGNMSSLANCCRYA